MTKSYNQKAQAYFAIISANPKITANAIGKRYTGTELGMRKQDRNDLVKAIKEQLNQRESFIQKMTNSNMKPETLKKLSAASKHMAYNYAKKSTRKAQPKLKEGQIISSVRSLEQRVFGKYRPDSNGHYEFY